MNHNWLDFSELKKDFLPIQILFNMIAERNVTIKQIKLKVSKKVLLLYSSSDSSSGIPLMNNMNNKATKIGITQKKYLMSLYDTILVAVITIDVIVNHIITK